MGSGRTDRALGAAVLRGDGQMAVGVTQKQKHRNRRKAYTAECIRYEIRAVPWKTGSSKAFACSLTLPVT